MREIKIGKYRWIDIEDPVEKDIKFLEKEFGFHHLALEDCLSTIQRPKLDYYENYIFLVFHLPKYIKKSCRTVALEMDVFLGNNFVVTLHSGALKPLDDLFNAYQRNEMGLVKKGPAYLLYEILNNAFNYCFPMLDKIYQKLERIEDELYENQTRKILEEITLVERDIINFRRIINPQRYVLKDLEATKESFIAEGLDVYFDDIVDKIERIWDMLDNYKEVSEALQRTNESILTQRLNEIIKILTIFSVIMLPLTVITGFYGMNINGLPFSNHKFASEIIAIILILTILGMLTYFYKKRWMR